eukprot:387785_1
MKIYLDPCSQSMSAANAAKREKLTRGFLRQTIHHAIEPPTDIVLLINIWLNVKDKWHIGATSEKIMIFDYEIPFNNITHSRERCQCVKSLNWDSNKTKWRHAFGSDLVKKGDKQSWILQIMQLPSKKNCLSTVIGIIDFDCAYSAFDSFWDSNSFGYAFDTMNKTILHNGTIVRNVNDFICNGCLVDDKITITLDMSGDRRLLTCSVLRPKDDMDHAHKISFVLFDCIDTNRDYRLCVAFSTLGTQLALVSSS